MARAPMPAPQMIETPAMRRSALLAKMLEQQRQPTEIKGGYGELGARLLAQGITQWGANRAEKAAREEGAARVQSQSDALNLQLAALLGGNQPQPEAMGAAPPPPMVAPIQNTQQPVEAMSAPVAPVDGAPMPPAAPAVASVAPPVPMPMADAPAMPQAPAPAPVAPQAPPAAPARNPLGITPGEETLIRRALSSGDAGQIAWAQGVLGEIEMRMASPSAERQEVVDQNGVKYLVDPTGANPPTPLFGEQGVPELARMRTVVAGPNDPYGMVEGTTYQINPSGVASALQTPTAGYRRLPDGTLVPEIGGREDLGGNPTARFQAIKGLQDQVKTVLDQATSLNRNIQSVRAGLRAQNGAGDVATINGVQRLIDDGVVREGDVALQLRMQGLEGGIAGLMGYLRSNGAFSPEIRSQLSKLGEDLYSTQNALFREQAMGRREFVERTFGAGSFDDVVPPSVRQAYGWDSAPAGGDGSPPRVTTQAQYDALASGAPYIDPNGVRRTKQ